MKTEERKELEENSLAKSLGSFVDGVRQGPSRNTLIVLGLVGVVCILIGLFVYFSKRSTLTDAERWVQWHNLSDGSEMAAAAKQLPPDAPKGLRREDQRQRHRLTQLKMLERFAKANEDTLQGTVAQFQQARLALEQGMTSLGAEASHEFGLKLVKEAESIYTSLIDKTDDYPTLHQEALLNAGLARETLGNASGSKELLERVKNEYKNSAAAKRAEEALARQSKYGSELKRLVGEFVKN